MARAWGEEEADVQSRIGCATVFVLLGVTILHTEVTLTLPLLTASVMLCQHLDISQLPT